MLDNAHGGWRQIKVVNSSIGPFITASSRAVAFIMTIDVVSIVRLIVFSVLATVFGPRTLLGVTFVMVPVVGPILRLIYKLLVLVGRCKSILN